MADNSEAGFAWQVGVWDRMAEIYQQEIDSRFAPVIQKLLDRAMLQPGESVLDLGTGTGSVEWVPKSFGSSPMLAIQSETSREDCRVVMHRPKPLRPANKNSPVLRSTVLR